MITELTFRELIENSGDVFIVVDREFKIRYVSSTVEGVAGIKPITLLGRNINEFVDRDNSEEWRKFLEGPTGARSCEIALELRKGTKSYFDVFVSNVSKVEGHGSLSLRLHDITAKKSREEKLVDSNRQLDQVIYKTTHDLKAPLTSAMGLLQIAERAPLEEKDEYIGLIRKSLFKLDRFIEEINHFFRSEKLALKYEPINLGVLIDEELENVRNLHKTGKLQISVNVDRNAAFWSDLIRVKTIVGNLITNAIKYADGDKDNPWISIRAEIGTHECVLTVEDNGIGIEPAYQNRVFEHYFRATNQSAGTGLGLFIVKDTIERLEGSINFESTPGIGTIFTVKLPNQLIESAGTV